MSRRNGKNRHRRMRAIVRRPAARWAAAAALLLGVFLALPYVLVHRFEPWEAERILPVPVAPRETLSEPADPIVVPVYRAERGMIVEVPLERYVRGVLAAEMPADFELEALKAQAIAARTYLARRLAKGAPDDMPPEAGDALITDTVQHQLFYSEDELREQWGIFGYARRMDRLTRAVNETKGLILTYEGEPIQATFFSTSNGYTENSENYWNEYVPYLRSVESPWDRLYSPNYVRTATLSFDEFYERLGLEHNGGAPVLDGVERTETGRIRRIDVNGHSFDGRTFRERLGLASADAEWKIGKDRIEFTTYGYGHGVGMSQWGANGMAKLGKTAEDILSHYYTNVEIVPMKAGKI